MTETMTRWKMLNPWVANTPKFLISILFSTTFYENFTACFLLLKRHSKVYVESKVIFYGSRSWGNFFTALFHILQFLMINFDQKKSQMHLLYFLFTYPSLKHCWIKQILFTSLCFGFHSCRVFLLYTSFFWFYPY